jgi:sugar phosphate isomerase/epimerase
VRPARELRWPDLVWDHFSRPRFGDFDERVAAAAEAGFAGIGLYVGEYARLRDEEGRAPRDIRAQLDDYGLVLADIEVVRGWCDDDGGPSQEGRGLEALAYEMADGIGARYLQAVGPYRGTVAEAAAAFGALCDRAAEHGLLVGIEWLPFTNITTAADAQAIVEGSGRTNAGYCADIWHHRRGTNDDAMLRRLDRERIFAIQMNDGPMQPNLDGYKEDCMRFRVPPGEGELDAVGFVRLLTGMGVSSPISLEVCSTELWAAPASVAAQRAADGMRRVLAAAGEGR